MPVRLGQQRLRLSLGKLCPLFTFSTSRSDAPAIREADGGALGQIAGRRCLWCGVCSDNYRGDTAEVLVTIRAVPRRMFHLKVEAIALRSFDEKIL